MRFSLDDVADRQARTYSGGMRRRLDLALSLLARPPVLMLDEPTAGLDPRSRAEVWALIEEQVAEGRRCSSHPVPGGGGSTRPPRGRN